MSQRETYSEVMERGVMHNERIAPCVGKLLPSGPTREIRVEYEGRNRVARLVSGVNRSELVKPENHGREVLLLFEAGDPDRPIIIALMDDPLEQIIAMEIAPTPSSALKDVLIDGKRIAFEAREEIILKCGAGSITLRKDGKITLKGTHLLSRASCRNRIKGGSIDMN